MINNKTITLFCLSTDLPEESLRVMKHCYSVFPHFDQIKLLTSYSGQEDKVEIVKVDNVKNYNDYNKFMVESISDYITTDFCLVVQSDGYIINPGSWDSAFLNYDYIGAPWPWLGNICGNGGFSLRSKKILDLASKLKYVDGTPEDNVYCLNERDYFINNNVLFPDAHLASKFSFEHPTGFQHAGLHASFGFHGKFHMASVPKI